MNDKEKYYEASEKIANLTINHPCDKELTPKLQELGLLDLKPNNNGELISHCEGVPARWCEKPTAQGSSEANSPIAMNGLREWVHNADEALVQLDHARYDWEDYDKCSTEPLTYGNKYSHLNNISDAKNFFNPNHNDKDKKSVISYGKGDKVNCRSVMVSDLGMGQDKQGFIRNMVGLVKYPSSKRNLSYAHAKYGMGLFGLNAHQNKKTLCYSGAISKIAEDIFVKIPYREDEDGYRQFCLNIAINSDVFSEGGSLFGHEHESVLNAERFTGYYTLQLWNGSGWSHPILHPNYNFEPDFSNKPSLSKFKNPAHGTTNFAYDVNLHNESQKISNINTGKNDEDSPIGDYYSVKGMQYLAISLENITHDLAYPINIVQNGIKEKRDKAGKDNGGGDSCLCLGFNKRLEKDNVKYEVVPIGQTKVKVKSDERTINSSFIYCTYNPKENSGQKDPKLSMSGAKYKAGNSFAEFIPPMGMKKIYELPSKLHNFLSIIHDFDDGKISHDLTSVSRDRINLPDDVKKKLNLNVKEALYDNPRFKEIHNKFSPEVDKDSNLIDIDLLGSHNFPSNSDKKGCKKNPSGEGGFGNQSSTSDLNFSDQLSVLEIKKNTLYCEVDEVDEEGNKSYIYTKRVNDKTGRFNVVCVTDVESKILDSIAPNWSIFTSSDGGKTWSESLQCSVSIGDGCVKFFGLYAPKSKSMLSDQFMLKIEHDIDTSNKNVDNNFDTSPILLTCEIAEKPSFDHDGNTRERPMGTNGKGGFSCPLSVVLVKDVNDLVDDDGNSLFWIKKGSSDSEDVMMTKEDLLGFDRSSDGGFVIYLNPFEENYQSYLSQISETDEINFNSGVVSICQTIMSELIVSNGNELHSIDQINSTFHISAKMLSVAWADSYKKVIAKKAEKAPKTKAKQPQPC
tara:strand:- start:5712 stop:8432 length:2721 start_codon:yes stop_codon:yes gene_type:complete